MQVLGWAGGAGRRGGSAGEACGERVVVQPLSLGANGYNRGPGGSSFGLKAPGRHGVPGFSGTPPTSSTALGTWEACASPDD